MDRTVIWVFLCVLCSAALAMVHGDDLSHAGIDELMDVLNLQRLRSRIEEGKWKLYGVIEDNAAPCMAEVSAYLDALKHGAPWANMMYDATGRYSSQFTFGNGFWLGSKALCLELDKMASNRIGTERALNDGLEDGDHVEKSPEESSFPSQHATEIPSERGLRKDEDVNDSFPMQPQQQRQKSPSARPNGVLASPPYRLRFHIARIELNLPEDLSPKPRQVLLGVCMPRTCDTQAISQLINISAAEQNVSNPSAADADDGHIGRSVKVIRVRPIPGDYDWKKDPKTYVLGGVPAVILVLMAMAEAYESIQSCRRRVLDDEEDRPKRESKDVEKGKNNNIELVSSRKRRTTSIDSSPALLGRVLLCFSARRNGRKILSVTDESGKEDQSLACIHGLRTISLAWVIMVHTYLTVFAIAENKKLRSVTERDVMFQTVSNATFSVDTFFTISGLLVAYLYFRTKGTSERKGEAEGGGDTSGNKKNRGRSSKEASSALATDTMVFFKLLGYRFLRLTPPYLWVIGIAEVGMRWQLNGSVFEPRIADGVTCAKYWWRNALYINSLFPQNEMCMLWSWYMANDTQFYALGIVLLLIAVRYFRFAAVAGLAFLIISWITTAVIAIQYDYHVSIPDPFALFDQLYDKPWLRLGPYLVGMFTGWMLYETAFRIKIPKMAVLSGWVLSLSCMAALVYGVALVGHPLPSTGAIGLSLMGSAAYASFGHTAWAIAVAWIIVACSTGNGGWISGFLSWSALRPLSRLAYCAYLIHPLVMLLTAFQMDGPLHLHNSVVVVIYLGYMSLSYILAFLISIFFEAPAVSLLKMIFQPPRTNRSENRCNDK